MKKDFREVYETQHRILNIELLKGCNQSKIYIHLHALSRKKKNVKLQK